MSTSKYKYVSCNESDIPPNTRFDVPARNAGQIIEIAYGGPMREHAEHDDGDPWKRVTDKSTGLHSHVYYRRVGV